MPLRKHKNTAYNIIMSICMKELKRVMGVDDGPFDRERDTTTVIVGVMTRFDGYVEGVATGEVDIDGTNATDAVISLFAAHFSSQIDFLLLNGVTLAGFNMCDIERIYAETGVPVISITRKEPDIGSMGAAIRKHFSDYAVRISILEKTKVHRITVRSGAEVFVNVSGVDIDEAAEVVKRSIVRGNIPEPIRLAHMIAGSIKKGENRGRS